MKIRRTQTIFKFCLLLAFVSAINVTQANAASYLNRLESASRQTKAKEYEQAIKQTQPLLDKLLLDTVEEIILAHRILGVAHCELGDQQQAAEHFQALVAFSPSESVSKLVSTKPCQTLFDEIRAGRSTSTAVSKAASSADGSSVETVRTTSHLDTMPMPSQSTSTWKLYVPFGVGQFANGQRAKGLAFASGEVALMGLAISSFLLFQSEKNSDGTFSDPDLASTYRALYWSSLGVGIGVMAWGIVDAVWVHKRSQGPMTSKKAFTFDGARVAFSF